MDSEKTRELYEEAPRHHKRNRWFRRMVLGLAASTAFALPGSLTGCGTGNLVWRPVQAIDTLDRIRYDQPFTVTSNVKAACIFVNGEFRGHTPLTLELPYYTKFFNVVSEGRNPRVNYGRYGYTPFYSQNLKEVPIPATYFLEARYLDQCSGRRVRIPGDMGTEKWGMGDLGAHFVFNP